MYCFFLSETKSQNLVRQVGHDIRSPLSALNVIANSLTDIPEKQKYLLTNAIVRINEIADDILAQANLKVQSATAKTVQDMLLGRTDVGTLVRDIIEEKQAQYVGKNVEFCAEIADGASCFEISSKELKRILSNIINNSMDSFEGLKPSAAETFRVSISLRNYTDSIHICVIDNGRGIPADVLKRIGEPGFSYQTVKSNRNGSGLGFSHAKKYLNEIGSAIQIQSTEGLGTMVSIVLKKIVEFRSHLMS